jgi:hypothetical protein
MMEDEKCMFGKDQNYHYLIINAAETLGSSAKRRKRTRANIQCVEFIQLEKDNQRYKGPDKFNYTLISIQCRSMVKFKLEMHPFYFEINLE